MFSPLLDIKWGNGGGGGGGGGGVDQVPKVLRHFLPKYWLKVLILGLYKSYLSVVQNGPTQMVGVGG